MKILITGSSGLVGTELQKQLSKDSGFEVLALSHKDLDVTDSFQLNTVWGYEPDLIVHLAGLLNQDYCEMHPEEAWKVNVEGTRNIVEIANKLNIPIFYLSSCSVFDGEKSTPYSVRDLPCPVNMYAKTKIKAEHLIQSLDRFYLLRSVCLYGASRDGFITLAIKKFQTEKDPQFAITGQIISIVSVKDLCDIIINLIRGNHYGIYHYSSVDGATRRQIIDFIGSQLNKTKYSFYSYDSSSKRPYYTVLDSSCLKSTLKIEVPTWKGPLKRFIDEQGKN